MFCDLVGSTSLAAKLDPEDWRNPVGSYLDAASAAVTSLGGHVLKKLGDGLMALFGYPRRRRTTASAPCARRWRSSARSPTSTRATPRPARPNSPPASGSRAACRGHVAGEVFGEAPNVAARVQAVGIHFELRKRRLVFWKAILFANPRQNFQVR